MAGEGELHQTWSKLLNWTDTVAMVALGSPTVVTISITEFLVALVTHCTIWVALISLVNMLLAHKVLVSKSKIVVEALVGAFIGLVGLVGLRPMATKTRGFLQSIGGRIGRERLRNGLPAGHAAWQVQLLSPTALCQIIDRIVRPWPKVILILTCREGMFLFTNWVSNAMLGQFTDRAKGLCKKSIFFNFDCPCAFCNLRLCADKKGQFERTIARIHRQRLINLHLAIIPSSSASAACWDLRSTGCLGWSRVGVVLSPRGLNVTGEQLDSRRSSFWN